MEFHESDKNRAVRRAVRSFCERELSPLAKNIDQEARFPWEVADKMGQLGYFGIQAPRETGGAGMDTSAYAIIIEEVSAGALPIPEGVLDTITQSVNETVDEMQLDVEVTALEILEGEAIIKGIRQ